MDGIEQQSQGVYFNHDPRFLNRDINGGASRHDQTLYSGEKTVYPISVNPLDELPSQSDCAFFFRQFLHNYDNGKLIRNLSTNLRAGQGVLDIWLEDILAYKPLPIEKCVTTPVCEKKEHIPPPGYLQKLFNALVLRPLHYLPVCEGVCMLEATNSVDNTLDKNEALQDNKENITDVQINLLNTITKAMPIRRLLAEAQERFVVVPGIVVQASRPLHKLHKMVIQCRYCDHKMTIQVPPWKDRLPIPRICRYSSASSQANLSGVMQNADRDLACKGQMDPYVIVPTECTYIDVQSLRVQELPEDVPTGDMPRHLHLNAARYLCEKMAPGDRVYVHGVLTSYNPDPKAQKIDGTNFTYLHILGYQKYDEGKGETTQFTLQEKSLFQSMANAPDIHSKIFKSIAPAIYGMDNVKKAAACLLFGGTRKQVTDGSRLRGDINFLMLGDPSVAKSQVLKFISRAAPISVYTSGKGSSAAGLTAAVIRDRHGVFSLEGGAMVLADGGVVCVDEFDKMGQDDVVAIHEAMEQQTISISKAGITTMLNTRCAVAAAANPSFGSFDDNQDTSEQHEFKATILSRFDLIFMLRDKENYERDTTLCSHILNLHAAKDIEGEIPIHLLRRYIQYAKQNYHPLLSREASDSLRNFYVKTRSEARDDKRASVHKIPITLRQLESLVRLAESLAKMELRELATEKHVQMAIDLFKVSTAETAKHNIVTLEALSPFQKKAVQQAEEAILGRLPKGQRVTRLNLLRDLQKKGFDRQILSKALFILIKKGTLQERGDRSVRCL